MNFRIYIFLFLSAVLTLSSCVPDADPETPKTPIEDFWPDDDVEEDKDEDNGSIGFQEEKDDPADDRTLTFDYSILAEAGHPRLLMSEKDFEDLKTRVGKDKASNKTLLQVHRLIIEKADGYASSTKAMSDYSEHEDNVAELLALSYAYRVTGAARYLARLKDDIKNILKWSTISGGELGTGEHSLAIAIVYDWLYYDLTYDERAGLRQFVTNHAIIPSVNFSFHGFYGNWNQVGNGGIICAALAMYEKNKAVAVNVIEQGLRDNKAVLQKILAGGGYPEGASYWNYGMSYQVALFQSLLNIFGNTAGLTEVPGVMDSGTYGLMMHGSIGTSFAYNDGGTTDDNPLIPTWWYAAQKQDANIVYGDYHLLMNKRYSEHYSRMTPLIPALLKSFNPDQVTTSKPGDMVWSCDGEMPLCVVRRGWNYDKTDYYLGIKGGYCNTWKSMKTSHGHMDAGSFVFEAEGIRWSDDVTRPGYTDWNKALKNAGSASSKTEQTDLKWGTFNTNALCHSTIVSYTNDGSITKTHATDHNVNGKATISQVIDNGTGQGAQVDMSAPLMGQVKDAKRTILLLSDGTLEVTDQITALDDIDSIIEWRMISQSTMSTNSSGIELTAVKDSKKKRKLSASCSNSEVGITYKAINPVIPSDWTGFTYIQTIKDRKIASWKATVPKGTTVTFTTTLKKI